MKKDRYFYMADIDCEMLVEVMSRKELLKMLDKYVENLRWLDEAGENPYCEFVDVSSDSFEILYKDGSRDYIDVEYDGSLPPHNARKSLYGAVHNKNAGEATAYSDILIIRINHTGLSSTTTLKVEHRGFEPLASTMRMLRAPNCANAPYIYPFYHNFGKCKEFFS